MGRGREEGSGGNACGTVEVAGSPVELRLEALETPQGW